MILENFRKKIINYHVIRLQIEKHACLYHKTASAPVVTHQHVLQQVACSNLPACAIFWQKKGGGRMQY